VGPSLPYVEKIVKRNSMTATHLQLPTWTGESLVTTITRYTFSSVLSHQNLRFIESNNLFFRRKKSASGNSLDQEGRRKDYVLAISCIYIRFFSIYTCLRFFLYLSFSYQIINFSFILPINWLFFLYYRTIIQYKQNAVLSIGY
jgi:hypothetical protein